MRYVRFWLTSAGRTEELVSIRGQYGQTEDDPQLYEISHRDGVWKCLKWIYLETDPDAHAFQEIESAADCFSCMVAAELDARKMAEDED